MKMYRIIKYKGISEKIDYAVEIDLSDYGEMDDIENFVAEGNTVILVESIEGMGDIELLDRGEPL